MSKQSKEDSNRRRKLLIEPRFQMGFLAHTLSGALISAAIFYGSNRYFFWKFADYGHRAGLPRDHVFFSFLRTQEASLDRIFLGTVVFLCCTLVAYGLLYSNRIAGPVFRLRQHLKSHLKNGTSNELHFRQHDLFRDLEPLVNGCLRSHQKTTKGTQKAG